jgi:hypothetical protein
MRLAIPMLFLVGCAGAAPRTVARGQGAKESGAATREEGIHVSIPRAASLVYALDGAAGEIRHASGYPAMLGIEGEPAWLSAYRAARAELRGQVEDEDGWYTPLTRCSYEHGDVDDFLRCAKPVAGEHFPAIEAAVREADAHLAPKWEATSNELALFGKELERACASQTADALLARLREISSLPAGVPLSFQVVLVSKPMGGKNHAHQEGAFLVLEASKEMRAARLSSVVFHEIAHLAFHRAPAAVSALESSLAERGDVGVVAGNLWEESLASAFGNGIAAEKLDAEWHETDSMYADPAVDAVGHALFRRMRAGETFTLSSAAGKVAEVVDTAWPRARWRLRDVLQRVVLFADDPEIARTFAVRVRAIASYTKAPYGDDLDRAAKAPPGTPRLVLTSAGSLKKRKNVLSELGLTTKEIDKRLASSPAFLRWTHDARGIPLVVVVGRDASSTRAAVDKWSSAETLPTTEWTSL